MSRSLRIEYPGAYYHVMNRGICRREVFHTEDYAQLFYDALEEAHKLYAIEVHAYCLMGNHYHLCIRTPLGNLSKAMKYINGVFTQRYNKLMKLDGPIFRGRYRAILVDAQSYFLQLSKYIHLNPVTVGLTKYPQDYQWSSYHFFFNRQEKPTWLSLDETLGYFNASDPVSAYEKFVFDENNPQLKSILEAHKMFPVLGSSEFIEKIKKEYQDTQVTGLPELRQILTYNRPSVGTLFNVVSDYYKLDPDMMINTKKLTQEPIKAAIFLAVTVLCYSHKSVAQYFSNNISAWNVSKAYRSILLESKTNPALREDVRNIKAILEGVRA